MIDASETYSDVHITIVDFAHYPVAEVQSFTGNGRRVKIEASQALIDSKQLPIIECNNSGYQAMYVDSIASLQLRGIEVI